MAGDQPLSQRFPDYSGGKQAHTRSARAGTERQRKGSRGLGERARHQAE